MTKRILIYIVIIALGTLAGFGIYTLINTPIKETISNPSVRQSYKNTENELMGRGMCRRLGFDEEQRDKARKLEQYFRQQQQHHLSQLDSLRGALVQTLIKDNSNDSVINDISRKIGNHHTQMKQLSVKHIREIQAICDESQKQTLNLILEDLLKHPQYGNQQENKQRRRRNRRGRN